MGFFFDLQSLQNHHQRLDKFLRKTKMKSVLILILISFMVSSSLCLDLDLCSICVNLIDRIDTEKIIDIGAKACDFLGPFISLPKHAEIAAHCDALEKGELPPGIDADMVPNKMCKAIKVCS